MNNISTALETRHCPKCGSQNIKKALTYISECIDCFHNFDTKDVIVYSWTRNDTLSVPSEVQGRNLEQIKDFDNMSEMELAYNITKVYVENGTQVCNYGPIDYNGNYYELIIELKDLKKKAY